MLLSTIFSTLTFGELSQHQLGGKKEGFIAPSDYAEVVSHIQLGLTALAIRFPLRTKEIILQEQAVIKDYHLLPKYSVSAADITVPIPYLLDSISSPFLDDVLLVTSIKDKDGNSRSLNDESIASSITTPAHKTLHIPMPVEGKLNYLKYRADLPQIDISGGDPSAVSVDLPSVLLEPLCAWVGARALSFSNNQEQKSTSAFYFNKYEYRCAELELRNILNTSSSNSNIKPELRRFP